MSTFSDSSSWSERLLPHHGAHTAAAKRAEQRACEDEIATDLLHRLGRIAQIQGHWQTSAENLIVVLNNKRDRHTVFDRALALLDIVEGRIERDARLYQAAVIAPETRVGGPALITDDTHLEELPQLAVPPFPWQRRASAEETYAPISSIAAKPTGDDL